MICVPITASSQKQALHDIARSCASGDAIELRMDLIADGSLPELISAARLSSATTKIIVTCRRKEEAVPAGKALRSQTEKMRILRQAIELGADYIDIELAEGDTAINELKKCCRQRGGWTKIIVSYHDIVKTPSIGRLKEILHSSRKTGADVVKIATFARKPEDNLKVLALIPYARKYSQEIIALCMGEKGRISRVAGQLLGNHLGFAMLEWGAQSAPGQLSVREMKQIGRLINGDKLSPKPPVYSGPDTEYRSFILIGNPVKQSLSPLMHNAALADLGIEGCYTAFCVHDPAAALQGMRGMDIRGASVTIPFKSAVMEYLDDIADDALKIGAVNTIINQNGLLTGFNTDWEGLMITLREAMTVQGKKFVILGAGGTARAAAYGIMQEGGLPLIVSRTEEKGKQLAKYFDCPFYPQNEIGKIKADCLINTTPVGMYPAIDESPVDAAILGGYAYVMDAIYNPLQTKLLREAEKMGCRTLSGLDMFVHQGAQQLKLWTGREPNRELMKKVVRERLNN